MALNIGDEPILCNRRGSFHVQSAARALCHGVLSKESMLQVRRAMGNVDYADDLEMLMNSLAKMHDWSKQRVRENWKRISHQTTPVEVVKDDVVLADDEEEYLADDDDDDDDNDVEQEIDFSAESAAELAANSATKRPAEASSPSLLPEGGEGGTIGPDHIMALSAALVAVQDQPHCAEEIRGTLMGAIGRYAAQNGLHSPPKAGNATQERLFSVSERAEHLGISLQGHSPADIGKRALELYRQHYGADSTPSRRLATLANGKTCYINVYDEPDSKLTLDLALGEISKKRRK